MSAIRGIGKQLGFRRDGCAANGLNEPVRAREMTLWLERRKSAHIPPVVVRSIQAISIAAWSVKRWRKHPTWIASAITRDAPERFRNLVTASFSTAANLERLTTESPPQLIARKPIIFFMPQKGCDAVADLPDAILGDRARNPCFLGLLNDVA